MTFVDGQVPGRHWRPGKHGRNPTLACIDCGAKVARSRIARCRACFITNKSQPRITDHQSYIRERSAPSKTGCWLWTGPVTKYGYGICGLVGGGGYAHRIAFIAWNGDIPKGLTVQHDCHVTKCVNPAHLSLLSRSANTSEGNRYASGESCINGHVRAIDGFINTKGHWVCRACAREHQRRIRRDQDISSGKFVCPRPSSWYGEGVVAGSSD